jgi:hypothetical protein
LSTINPGSRLRRHSLDPHLARPHQPLHPVGSVIAEVTHQERIDADSVQVVFNGEVGLEGGVNVRRHERQVDTVVTFTINRNKTVYWNDCDSHH